MICIDNSEWMRNGDYSPSRFQAQADAVNLICGAKTQVNRIICIIFQFFFFKKKKGKKERVMTFGHQLCKHNLTLGELCIKNWEFDNFIYDSIESVGKSCVNNWRFQFSYL